MVDPLRRNRITVVALASIVALLLAAGERVAQSRVAGSHRLQNRAPVTLVSGSNPCDAPEAVALVPGRIPDSPPVLIRRLVVLPDLPYRAALRESSQRGRAPPSIVL